MNTLTKTFFKVWSTTLSIGSAYIFADPPRLFYRLYISLFYLPWTTFA